MGHSSTVIRSYPECGLFPWHTQLTFQTWYAYEAPIPSSVMSMTRLGSPGTNWLAPSEAGTSMASHFSTSLEKSLGDEGKCHEMGPPGAPPTPAPAPTPDEGEKCTLWCR